MQNSSTLSLERKKIIEKCLKIDSQNELSDLERIRRAKIILMTNNPLFIKAQINLSNNQNSNELLEKQKLTSKVDFFYNKLYNAVPENVIEEQKSTLIKNIQNNIHRGSFQGSMKFNYVQNYKNIKISAENEKKAKKFQSNVKKQEKQLKKCDSELLDKVNNFFQENDDLVFMRSFLKGGCLENKLIDGETFNPFNFFDCNFPVDFGLKHKKNPFVSNNLFEINEMERIDDVFFTSDRIYGNLWKVGKVSKNVFNVWIQKETNSKFDNINFRFSVVFAYKNEAKVCFRIQNLNESLTKIFTKLILFSKTGSETWQRNIVCQIKDGVLEFIFTKSENIENVEFSLFPPFLIEKVWEKAEKLQIDNKSIKRKSEKIRRESFQTNNINTISSKTTNIKDFIKIKEILQKDQSKVEIDNSFKIYKNPVFDFEL